jgi:hypothetical protein
MSNAHWMMKSRFPQLNESWVPNIGCCRPSVNNSATAVLVQWILQLSESPAIQFGKGKAEIHLNETHYFLPSALAFDDSTELTPKSDGY